MQITKLRTKNFKSIGGQILEIDFKTGLYATIGDVGTGKTTIFSAITYVLFNKNTDFKGNTKTTLPINKLINDINKKELLVEMELDNGYTIKRGQKPDIFEIWKDGTNLANKSVTIDQSFLENTVLEGMTFDIFLSTAYLSNKPGSIPFLHMSQSQRKEYIEKILDLRRIYFYNENLKKYIAENKLEKITLDKQKILLEESITNEEFNLSQQEIKKTQAEAKLKEYLEQHQTRLQAQKDKLKEISSQKKILEDGLENIKIPQEQVQEIQDKIQDYNKQIKLIQENQEKEIIQAQQEIQDQISRKAQELKDLNFKIEMTTFELKDRSELLQDEQELLYTTLVQDIDKTKEQLSKLKTIMTQKSAEYQAFINSRDNYHFCGTCPTLSKIIGSYDIQAYEGFVEKAQSSEKTLQDNIQEKETIVKNIKQIKEANSRIIQETQAIENELKIQQATQDSLKTQLKQLQAQVEQLKNDKINQDELKIQNLQSQIKFKESEIGNLLQSQKSKIQADISLLESQIASSIELYKSIEAELPPTIPEISREYLESLYSKKEDLLKQIDDEYNKSSELEELKSEINSPEHKARAIRKYIPIFETKLNEILEKFMEDDTFTLVAKLDDEFDLTFYKNSKEISIFSLSSGQVACTSLACTFAFLYLLEVKHQNRFNHLLIDELLDLHIGVRIHKVLDYLKMNSVNKNISVISHNKNLDFGIFDGVIEVSKGDIFSEYRIA